jgi:hypothetical protein
MLEAPVVMRKLKLGSLLPLSLSSQGPVIAPLEKMSLFTDIIIPS